MSKSGPSSDTGSPGIAAAPSLQPDDRFAEHDLSYRHRMVQLEREARMRPDHLIGVVLSEAEAESLGCNMYRPAQATDADPRACMGKGHYLCQGCAHLALSPAPYGDDL